MDTHAHTLDADMIREAREFFAVVRSMCLTTRRLIVVPRAVAVRAVVRRAVVRLHAARSAIEDAAAIASHGHFTSPIGTAVSGFRAFGESFKNFKRGMHMKHAVYVLSGTLKRAIRDSGLPQTELAARISMAQTRLSALLRDTRFNDHTKALVTVLGSTLGVAAENCCRRVGRERRAS